MDAAFARLLDRVVSTYRHALADSPTAREWLARRGVSDMGLLERFQVGLSDGSLPSLARGEVLDRLKLLGLLDAEGRERFAGSIVVPCFDDEGVVVQLAAYDPDGRLSWLFAEETPCFWNGSSLRHARDVLLVADPLAGLAAGTDAVIAPAGPGTPLGQGAKDQILAHRPRVTLKDCDRLSARRDHRKYLGLIRAVAFAHRFQRKVEGEDLVVGLEDVAIANRLAHEVLGHSIFDLTPSSRRLLIEIREWLNGDDRRFSQRELRERTGWRKTQLALHVRELVEAEYLVAHASGPGRRTRYALDWDGRGLDGERFYKGLVDVATLEAFGPLPGHFRDSSGSPKPPRKARQEPIAAESASSDRTSGEKQS